MASMNLLLAALFLPLFPFSMLFNRLFARVSNPALRIALLVAWPSAGLGLLSMTEATPPAWIQYWAVATALLYAFRALALRDLALWLSHVATSAWAMLWLPAVFGETGASVAPQLAAFSLPLALLAWLTGRLESSFGAAFAGSPGGLATSVPRLSGLLVLTVLAAIGTPVFPSFFALLGLINTLLPTTPVSALGVVLVWMLWAWAGMRILQGLIVGQPGRAGHADIGLAQTGVLGFMVAVLTLGGIWISGSLV